LLAYAALDDANEMLERGVFGTVGLVFTAMGVAVVLPDAVRIDGRSQSVQFKRAADAVTAIHAVQIIKKVVTEHDRGRERAYVRYEVNLVTVRGSRVHLVDYDDAATGISRCLDCQMWDATTTSQAA
jgi:hypothetical protein